MSGRAAKITVPLVGALVTLALLMTLATGCRSDPKRSLVLDVFDLVDRYYVAKVDHREMVAAALQGLLDRAKLEVQAAVRTEEIKKYLVARDNGEDPPLPFDTEDETSPTPIPTPYDDAVLETTPTEIKLTARGKNFQRKLPYNKRELAETLLAGVEFLRATLELKQDESEALHTALDAMLYQLDPHSGFLNLTDYTQLRQDTQGSFGGVGVEIGMRNGLLTVVAPIDDSPGAKAGIKARDTIVAIDRVDTYGQTLEWAVQRIRGKIGTSVLLSIKRDGLDKPLDITVERGKIRAVATKSKMLPGRVGYVRIIQFSARTTNDLRDAIQTFEQTPGGMRCLVLDFRNNPGGLLDQAVEASDLFLDSGLIVNAIGRGYTEEQEYFAKATGTRTKVPIVALVNPGSASASEIVVGALKDQGRALVVGYQTFGKGTVQSIFELPQATGLRLTTAMFYTPSGESIQAHGITPNVRFDLPETERPVVTEHQLTGHLKNVKNQDPPTPDVAVDAEALFKYFVKRGWLKETDDPDSDDGDLTLTFVQRLLQTDDLSVSALLTRARTMVAEVPAAS